MKNQLAKSKTLKMRKHRNIRFFILIFVLVIQVCFLVLTIIENYEANVWSVSILGSIVTFLIILATRFLDLHHEEYDYEKLSVALWVPVGGLMCYQLHTSTDLSNVVSSALVGLGASFLPNIKSSSEYLKKLPAAIYCGTFIGMTSMAVQASILVILAAGLVSGLLYILSKNIFVGVGGKLGTIAFVGVVVLVIIDRVL